MSIVSGITRIRSHKVHNFYYYQPNNPNDTISRGLVLDLFGSSDKKVGNVVINGFNNYIGDKYVEQVTLSLFLENGSLNFISIFNTIKNINDTLGKTVFPNKIVTRDQNGKNLLVIIAQNEKEQLKIDISIQHI
jgi:hypothetical protein